MRVAKRKRKAAGPRIAPWISMSAVELLSETEWQPFLRLLPCRSEPTSLRSKLDCLLWTYLNILEAEANSPSAREVATVLETIARFAHAFAGYLYAHHLHSQGERAFNTANEAAGDILAKIEIKPENGSVLGAASRANETLAAAAAREARKLRERSKKGKPIQGEPTAWLLRQLADLLRESGLSISLPRKWDEPFCVLSQHFLRVALTRAKSLSEPGLGMQGNPISADAQRASFSWPATAAS